jgi:hypothetical protein
MFTRNLQSVFSPLKKHLNPVFVSQGFINFIVCRILYCEFSIRVRKNLRKHVGDVDAGAVPCGFGRAIGNKVRMSTFMMLICTLLAITCH